MLCFEYEALLRKKYIRLIIAANIVGKKYVDNRILTQKNS